MAAVKLSSVGGDGNYDCRLWCLICIHLRLNEAIVTKHPELGYASSKLLICYHYDIFPAVITDILVLNANSLYSNPSRRFCHFRGKGRVYLRHGVKGPRSHSRKEVRLGLRSRPEPCSFHMPFRWEPSSPGFRALSHPSQPPTASSGISEKGVVSPSQPSRNMMP